ncbi:NAD kinase [Bartonella sp. HY761]|uniref:NAD kinase n=1 Tax=Bartonella sp. HY761 TaxID=2979330 RepID=UPI0022021D0B|nr:NAD kinase [Bartonella sp. HY761]UXN07321.1 NAD kinase [Bartonella sp. HY761]
MPKFHFIAAETPNATKAAQALIKHYGQNSAEEATTIIVLGGDGTMLQVVRDFMNSQKPIYGMNRGSIGFLMNEYEIKNLPERISVAHMEEIHPLEMIAESKLEGSVKALAINEVSLFRQSYQAAKIKISIDNQIRMEELICDGIMAATPAGSTAYNLSAQGPILPLLAPLIALTPVSPFRPRRWHGALLPNTATIRFDMLEQDKRPVNAAADNIEVKTVTSVTIYSAKDITARILFDPNHSWDERILSEQFKY